METENQALSHYDAVIADLQAQRDKIDAMIASLVSFRSGAGLMAAAPGGNTPKPETGIVETAGMFLGMSIVDAAKKLLSQRKQTLGNVEITRALQAGGLAMTSADPVNTVGSVLTRRFNQVGDVVRVGRGTWGLKEWYPGRNFKTASKSGAAIVEEAIAVAKSETPPPPVTDPFELNEENAGHFDSDLDDVPF